MSVGSNLLKDCYPIQNWFCEIKNALNMIDSLGPDGNLSAI